MDKNYEKRQITIKSIVPNLRNRWKDELEPFTDNAIASLYEDFSMSDDHGNNDEKFPTWFDDLPFRPV